MFTDEIAQQPDALRDLVRHYRSEEGSATLNALREAMRDLREESGARSVTFTGMGSSLYAAYSVTPLLRATEWRAEPIEAGEALNYGAGEGWKPQGVVVAISQSGESAETRALAERLAPTSRLIAITNDPDSGLSRAARVTLPLCAGEEAAISAKTYSNTLGTLLILAAVLTGERLSVTLERLEATADAMEAALSPQWDDPIRRAADAVDNARSVHFIGRGPSLAAAYEGALVIGEGAHVTAVGLPGGSFRHGPLELAEEGHVAVLFMPNGPTRHLMEKLRRDLLRVGSRVLAVTDTPSEAFLAEGIELALGAVPTEAHFPLVAVMAVERLLAAVAARRGLVPGEFRHGGKVTAEE